VLLAVLAALALDSRAYRVEARAADPAALAAAFDDAWTIPRSAAGRGDLAADLAALVARRFEPRGGGAFAQARTLGDVVARFAARRGEREATLELLRELERERPDVWQAAGWALPQLVDESGFLSTRWNPERDRDDDGFLVGSRFSLKDSANANLARGRGRRELVQVATLLRADLWAAKQAEHDFRAWPLRTGANYDWVRPVRERYLVDAPEGARREARVRVSFRTDLPFPFGHYDCELDMRHRLDEGGHLVSDVTAVGEDFYWLAGQDLYLPLETGSGEFVALLYVRRFGTDLRGVPDQAEHLEAGCRQGMGGLKREAETLWRERGEREAIVRGLVPAFDVRGLE
jgi:hypothetical protein